jgi:hypothetical protein
MIQAVPQREFFSMSRRSANAARLFGLIMILMVCAWDVDAMRPHIAAHSWYTLGFVAVFLFVHLSDYLTVGRFVTRLDLLLDSLVDPFAPAVADGMARAGNDAQQEEVKIGRPTAKLYTFTAVTTTAAKVSGAPYPITQQHFVVKPE